MQFFPFGQSSLFNFNSAIVCYGKSRGSILFSYIIIFITFFMFCHVARSLIHTFNPLLRPLISHYPHLWEKLWYILPSADIYYVSRKIIIIAVNCDFLCISKFNAVKCMSHFTKSIINNSWDKYYRLNIYDTLLWRVVRYLFGRYYTCKTLRATMRIPLSLVTELVKMHSRRVHARTHATICARTCNVTTRNDSRRGIIAKRDRRR